MASLPTATGLFTSSRSRRNDEKLRSLLFQRLGQAGWVASNCMILAESDPSFRPLQPRSVTASSPSFTPFARLPQAPSTASWLAVISTSS